jgi:hypothetical protein
MENPRPPEWFIRELRLIDEDLGAYFDPDREGWYIQKRRGREITTLCLVAPDGLHRELIREVGWAAKARNDPHYQGVGARRRKKEMLDYQRMKATRERYRGQAEREADVISGRRSHAMGAPGAAAAPPIVAATDKQRYADIIPPDVR